MCYSQQRNLETVTTAGKLTAKYRPLVVELCVLEIGAFKLISLFIFYIHNSHTHTLYCIYVYKSQTSTKRITF